MKHNKSFVLPMTPALLVRAIITLNIAMFTISLIFSGKDIGLTLNPMYALTPSLKTLAFLGASGRIPISEYGSWWSLFTANWLHGGILHILFNMMALKTVAPLVIKEYGPSRMFIIYTLSGAVGFIFSYLGNVPVTIGASAGLCGLIGSLWYFGRSRGGHWGHLVYKQTSGWLVSLALIGFLLPNIDNWGHAGGLLGGIVFGWLFSYTEKRTEHVFHRVFSILLALMVISLLGRSIVTGFVLIFL